MPRFKMLAASMLVVCWIGFGATGLFWLASHAAEAGAPARAPIQLPVKTELPNLHMYLHPRCPCSRASVGELSRLMARLQGRMRGEVHFLLPPGEDEAWARTDLWESAAAIPGVSCLITRVADDQSGSRTSGQVLLYDQRGRLRYAGGITATRGHAGDSAGQQAIVALVEGRESIGRSAPVFGCALAEPICRSAAP